MRKTLIFTAILAITACGAAHAGVLSSAGDWALENALQLGITAIITLASGLFGGTWIGKAALKSKIPLKELTAVAMEIRKARRADSPGGKSLTSDERERILKRAEAFINSVATACGKGK